MLLFLCLLIGFICFVAAALGASLPRVNLVAAGLAAWILPALIGAWPK